MKNEHTKFYSYNRNDTEIKDIINISQKIDYCKLKTLNNKKFYNNNNININRNQNILKSNLYKSKEIDKNKIIYQNEVIYSNDYSTI